MSFALFSAGDGCKQDATSKFQSLQHVFEVLLDEEKRKIYDATGEDPDASEALFGKLSPEDILRFCHQHFGQVTEERIVEMEVSGIFYCKL